MDRNKKLEELYELVKECLSDSSIGVCARPVFNGADYYECPACGSTTNVLGNVFGNEGLWAVDNHKEGCAFMKIQEIVNSLEEVESKN